MKELFVDTGAWLALADRRDRYHAAARAAYPTLLAEFGRLITTSYVVAETYTLIRRRIGHPAAVKFLESLSKSHRLMRVAVARELETEAELLLVRYADQAYSYVDAISFAVMQERGVNQAFAFDHHFATMGFRLRPTAVTSA